MIPPFKLPHKPDYLSLEEWSALLRRSNRACEVGCPENCTHRIVSDGQLEVGHAHARHLGGENSIANCRFECAAHNRSRGAAPDERWANEFWFDQKKSFDGLRRMQMAAGPGMVQQYADLFLEERAKLLNAISLFALVTGAGKTMLMVSVLLAINEEVNARKASAPRVGRVLWFVHERALGDQLKRELSGCGRGDVSEIVKYGLHHTPPSVRLCTETGDLECGPLHHDFTISCPHALWDRKNQRRSDTEIAEILSQYDTIVWDECDFAHDQIARLVKLSPHALKFGLTATPIDGDGDFLKKFVLAGQASYRQVFAHDGCLAVLQPWATGLAQGFVRAIPHAGFSALNAGVEEHFDGQHGDKSSLPGSMAAIRQAIEQSSELERQMRIAIPEKWYSPHILIRCASIQEARHFKAQTDMELAQRSSELFGEGWRTTIMHQGLRGVPKCETRLFHDNPKDVHPFMRAKAMKGRCDHECSRILFVVDMGVRGLNNWPISLIVDVKRGDSVNGQVQLLGRAMRLPPSLSDIANASDDLRRFTTIHYFYADCGGSSGSMEEAVDFVLSMEERFEAAGLLQWSDLLGGRTAEVTAKLQGSEQPFTLGDRVQIDAALGELIENGVVIDEPTIEDVINSLPPELTAKRRERASEHIEKLLEDETYRRSLWTIENVSIIRPISREEPKRPEDYSVEELVRFVSENDRFAKNRADVLQELFEGRSTTRLLVGDIKHGHDARLYRKVPKLFRLHTSGGEPGILTKLSSDLAADLAKRRIISWDNQDIVRKAAARAASVLFGVDNTKNDGPLDQPSYHHAMLQPNTQGLIKEMAYKLLVQWGAIPHVASAYGMVREGMTDAA